MRVLSSLGVRQDDTTVLETMETNEPTLIPLLPWGFLSLGTENGSQVEFGKFLEWRRQNWKSRETKMARTLRLECQGRQSCTEAEPRNEQSPPPSIQQRIDQHIPQRKRPKAGKAPSEGRAAAAPGTHTWLWIESAPTAQTGRRVMRGASGKVRRKVLSRQRAIITPGVNNPWWLPRTCRTCHKSTPERIELSR